jgi:hypothetical protein
MNINTSYPMAISHTAPVYKTPVTTAQRRYELSFCPNNKNTRSQTEAQINQNCILKFLHKLIYFITHDLLDLN